MIYEIKITHLILNISVFPLWFTKTASTYGSNLMWKGIRQYGVYKYGKPSLQRINWRGGSKLSVIVEDRYNRVKEFSWTYTIGCIANTRNNDRNTNCDYINVLIL